jgi:hypothetical protein
MIRWPKKPLRSFSRSLWLLLFVAGVFAFWPRTATAQVGPYAEGPDVSRWIAERARRSRTGRRERVRIPLVHRSDGWGCICPEYYIGLSTGTTGTETWIEPRFERRSLRLRKNTIVLAEGYFTGTRPRRDLRSSREEPEEWIYRLWEFHVTRVRKLPDNHDFYNEEAPENRVVVLSPSLSTRRKVAIHENNIKRHEQNLVRVVSCSFVDRLLLHVKGAPARAQLLNRSRRVYL